MEKKSHCHCKCHKTLDSIKSNEMITPIPLKALSSCKSENKNRLLNKPIEDIHPNSKDGDFINYSNTSFTSEGPVKYGEEQDVDDL